MMVASKPVLSLLHLISLPTYSIQECTSRHVGSESRHQREFLLEIYSEGIGLAVAKYPAI